MKKIIEKSVLFACIFLLLPMMVNAESDSSRINQQRKAIGRALIEVQSAEWPSIMQYYTNDIEYQDPIVTIKGIEMMSQYLDNLFGSSPDLVTTIEDETCINGIYTATWKMVGYFDGVPYDAKGMSIMKFRPKETQVYYQKDYYTEGDIMINIPGLAEATEAFRTYYRCSVDPTFTCPF
ncbi:MAG: nuclear transport factor 2 family protein [Desulfatirhabdiaceae bacterium]